MKKIFMWILLILLVLVYVFRRDIIVECTYDKNNGVYNGIDVSHHNGRIYWNEVAEDKNIKFAYIKATEGASHTDSYYKRNVRRARKNSIRIGSYHYFRMTSSAQRQFNNFKSVVDKNKQDLIPMVDVETTDGHSVKKTRKRLKEFLRLVENYYGVKPMIYTSNRSDIIRGRDFKKYKLYLARYSKHSPIIQGYDHYFIWQYSDKGRIKGIRKPVDLCRFHPDHSIKEIIY